MSDSRNPALVTWDFALARQGTRTVKDLIDDVLEHWRVELPDQASVQIELIKRIARTFVLIEVPLAKVLTQFKLTRAEYDVLTALRTIGEPYQLRPTDLTARLLLTSAGTAKVTRHLAQLGLVSREPDATDARSAWIRLTPEGILTASEVIATCVAAQVASLAAVESGTLQRAADAMREVLVAIGDRAPQSRTPQSPQ